MNTEGKLRSENKGLLNNQVIIDRIARLEDQINTYNIFDRIDELHVDCLCKELTNLKAVLIT
jgi:hypothetical protein|tara:strand:+ start:72 stop:257 length:186 start_codon:yes stop_codon:yes gene_type:complete